MDLREINKQFKRGDDSRASEWLRRYRRLRYNRCQCRAFRVGIAYKSSKDFYDAYKAIQKKRNNGNSIAS